MPLSRISEGPAVPAPLAAAYSGAGDPAGSAHFGADGHYRAHQSVQPPRPHRSRRSLRGLLIAVLALLITAGILFASWIPSLNGMGTAWTSFLPWTAVPLILLGALAAVRRAWWGLSAVIVAVMVWSAVFVPQLLPATMTAGSTASTTGASTTGASTTGASTPGAGTADLSVATQNIGAANSDPVAAARTLATSGAGIVAVQEIVGSAANATAVLDSTYPHHARVSTVGLWSVWPMDEPQPLELGLSWARAFRVVVHHDEGDIAVYAVHLPSVRPGDTAARDEAVAELAALVAADPESRVLVLGDLNTATTDPMLSTLTSELTDSRQAVKGGFGFTWPAQFPITRPDHVLGRGLTPVTDQVLAAAGSDHRAVLVGLDLQG